ncbi:hypothetical protein OH492_08635 [Vibrio chagasii]|nr:hypothetical protein [Vibrio chagasii]
MALPTKRFETLGINFLADKATLVEHIAVLVGVDTSMILYRFPSLDLIGILKSRPKLFKVYHGITADGIIGPADTIKWINAWAF